MAGAVWAVAELGSDGNPTRLSLEAATAARSLAAAAGTPAVGIVVANDPGAPAEALAAYLPRVVAIALPPGSEPTGRSVAEAVASLAAAEEPAVLVLGATADGREAAGVLAARLGRGVLGNVTGIAWSDGAGPGDGDGRADGPGDGRADGDGAGRGDGAPAGPRVEMSVLGGRALTTSAFRDGRGILTLRPNAVSATPADANGSVESVAAAAPPRSVRVVARADATTRSASIEESPIVVTGGRGIGGPQGVALLADLADALGGAVAATRAAVDAGWLPYAVQVGQTGRTIRPSVYLGVGVSGAIQHRVGMQDAETIIAINRDPDAPLAEHADLYVVGDLFEVVPALVTALRARAT